MTFERWIRLLAGSLVTLSLVLAHLHSPSWLILTFFVGLNLMQSALTGVCPAEIALRRLGVAEASGADGRRPPTAEATSAR
jgi:hypothetical protein